LCREFLHADDLTRAIAMLLGTVKPPSLCNIGTGVGVRIMHLARMIADLIGYRGRIEFDTTKPDGVFSKTLDTTLIRSTGWQPVVDLAYGIKSTYAAFLREHEQELVPS